MSEGFVPAITNGYQVVLTLCSETVESMKATCRFKGLVSLDELRRRGEQAVSDPRTAADFNSRYPPPWLLRTLASNAHIISDPHPLIDSPP